MNIPVVMFSVTIFSLLSYAVIAFLMEQNRFSWKAPPKISKSNCQEYFGANPKLKHIKSITEMLLKYGQPQGGSHLSRKPVPMSNDPLSKIFFLIASAALRHSHVS